eukprot:INCI4989.1.p1 GENE.INCI4989.1~~INCI4989.1.p1  ORF type:complete len:100 (-),score=18.66 INCI4989.1:138-437(-)
MGFRLRHPEANERGSVFNALLLRRLFTSVVFDQLVLDLELFHVGNEVFGKALLKGMLRGLTAEPLQDVVGGVLDVFRVPEHFSQLLGNFRSHSGRQWTS